MHILFLMFTLHCVHRLMHWISCSLFWSLLPIVSSGESLASFSMISFSLCDYAFFFLSQWLVLPFYLIFSPILFKFHCKAFLNRSIEIFCLFTCFLFLCLNVNILRKEIQLRWMFQRMNLKRHSRLISLCPYWLEWEYLRRSKPP